MRNLLAEWQIMILFLAALMICLFIYQTQSYARDHHVGSGATQDSLAGLASHMK